MRYQLKHLFFFIFIALALSGCKTVKIESPTEGEVLTVAPDITLTFPKGKPEVLQITLNGQDITAQFAVTDTGATASGSNISTYLVDGTNLLKIVKPNTPLRKFAFDNDGPRVHITDVTGSANGSLVISAGKSLYMLSPDNTFAR
jgi:hypothetical protein